MNTYTNTIIRPNIGLGTNLGTGAKTANSEVATELTSGTGVGKPSVSIQDTDTNFLSSGLPSRSKTASDRSPNSSHIKTAKSDAPSSAGIISTANTFVLSSAILPSLPYSSGIPSAGTSRSSITLLSPRSSGSTTNGISTLISTHTQPDTLSVKASSSAISIQHSLQIGTTTNASPSLTQTTSTSALTPFTDPSSGFGFSQGTTFLSASNTATISNYGLSSSPEGNNKVVDGTSSSLGYDIGVAPTTGSVISSFTNEPKLSPTASAMMATMPSASGQQLNTLNRTISTGEPPGLASRSDNISHSAALATTSRHTTSLETAESSFPVDSTLSPLQSGASTTSANLSPIPAVSAPSMIASRSSAYTIDGIMLEGDPNLALTVGSTQVIPGGPPVVVSSHTFVLPTSNTNEALFFNGITTNLPMLPTDGATSTKSSKFSFPTIGSFTESASVSLEGQSIKTASKTTATGYPGLDGPKSETTTSSEVVAEMITSTDTVAPTDASTQGFTNSALSTSGNYWLTTQVGGTTTIVPVIVGCPGCGRFGGIILWNFPQLPKVNFKFPKFPKLPTVSFPCVPIPLIKKCSSSSETPRCEYVVFFRSIQRLILNCPAGKDTDPSDPDGTKDTNPDNSDDSKNTDSDKSHNSKDTNANDSTDPQQTDPRESDSQPSQSRVSNSDGRTSPRSSLTSDIQSSASHSTRTLSSNSTAIARSGPSTATTASTYNSGVCPLTTAPYTLLVSLVLYIHFPVTYSR